MVLICDQGLENSKSNNWNTIRSLGTILDLTKLTIL